MGELLARVAETAAGPCRARGFQYGELPADLLERVPQWLRLARVPDGQEIRPNRAYRYCDWLVKLYGPGHPVKDRLRRSAAIRSADWYARLLPLRTPKPLLAVEIRSRGRLTGALLVTEYVDGPSLAALCRQRGSSAERGLEAFPRFLAAMHRARIHHGDVHPGNFLWDGQDWVLIDLDGMRGRRSIGRRIIERQWLRILLVLDDDDLVRRLFASYLRAAGLAWDPVTAWERVRQHAAGIRAERARRRGSSET